MTTLEDKLAKALRDLRDVWIIPPRHAPYGGNITQAVDATSSPLSEYDRAQAKEPSDLVKRLRSEADGIEVWAEGERPSYLVDNAVRAAGFYRKAADRIESDARRIELLETGFPVIKIRDINGEHVVPKHMRREDGAIIIDAGCYTQKHVEALEAERAELLAVLKLVKAWTNDMPIWHALITEPDDTFGKRINAAIAQVEAELAQGKSNGE